MVVRSTNSMITILWILGSTVEVETLENLKSNVGFPLRPG